MGYTVGEDGLSIQDADTLDASTLTPLSPEVISRQATINIGALFSKRRPLRQRWGQGNGAGRPGCDEISEPPWGGGSLSAHPLPIRRLLETTHRLQGSNKKSGSGAEGLAL